MRLFVLLGLASVVWACTQSEQSVRAEPSVSDEVVIVSPAVPGALAIVTDRGQLKVVEDTHYVDGGFSVDGRLYVGSEATSRERYKQHSAEDRLKIASDGNLLFDGQAVQLPRNARVREIYKAVVWAGWVIILARTSESDSTANMKPPFFANELVAFKQDRTKAMIRWLAAFPGQEISILKPAR